MGVSGAIMMAGSSLGNAYAQSQAAEAQGNFQKEMGDLNARLAEKASDEALNRGTFESNRAIQKGRQAAASARVAAAASGIDPFSGSARDVIDSGQQAALTDALMIKNNAVREAWGYKVEAINSRTTGQMAQLAGRNEARNSLLTGLTRAAAYGVEGYGTWKREGGGSQKSAKPSKSSVGDFYGSGPRGSGGGWSDYPMWWRSK
jgi:hypothetical protein